ncbi:MAG: NAD(P)-dependent oxidoreductase [Bacteroidales bacterium]|nr:NAD(P)-dependent oxidoreductase [Bacteroidales bacterium]
MINRKTCIVFGASGYIGSHLVYFLKNDGYEVNACDIQGTPKRVDVTVADDFKNIDWDVNCVFMFAGLSGTFAGFDDYSKYIHINEIGLLNVLNEIKKSGFKPRVIFPSSRLVYQGSDTALKEDDPKEAKTIYAVNKIACEHLLEMYRNSFDIPYVIYRICVPYGNNLGTDYSYGTMGFFLNQAVGKGQINLYGDGSLRRTFTSVEDICLQILMSCQDEKSVNQIYNTAGEEFSLKEIASLVASKYGAQVTFSEWPDRDRRIESGHTVFDSRKFLNEFDYRLKTTLINWLAGI